MSNFPYGPAERQFNHDHIPVTLRGWQQRDSYAYTRHLNTLMFLRDEIDAATPYLEPLPLLSHQFTIDDNLSSGIFDSQ